MAPQHFLARHDYDAVASRVWRADGASSSWDVASLDRTGLVTWSWWNPDPMVCAVEGAEQTFASLLDEGPRCAVDPAALDEMRAHLLARAAGSSTFVTVQASSGRGRGHGGAARVTSLLVNGAWVGASALAGREAPRGRFLAADDQQALVAPGVHRLTMHVALTVDGQRRSGTAECTVDIARGQHRALFVVLDVDHARPAGLRVMGDW